MRLLVVILFSLLATMANGFECIQQDSCDIERYRDSVGDTSFSNNFFGWDTVRCVVHVFGDDDGTNYTDTDAAIDIAIDSFNIEMINARLFVDHVINHIPITFLNDWVSNEPVGNPIGYGVLKRIVAQAPDSQMNIFIKTPTAGLGASVLPWVASADTWDGGVVVSDGIWATIPSVAIHEIGHYFGLLHTDIGIVQACGDSSCFEYPTSFGFNDSIRTIQGDMCSDTPPDPGFDTDGNPLIAFDQCSDTAAYVDNLTNFMSQTGGSFNLMVEFTLHQFLRGSCWLRDSDIAGIISND